MSKIVHFLKKNYFDSRKNISLFAQPGTTSRFHASPQSSLPNPHIFVKKTRMIFSSKLNVTLTDSWHGEKKKKKLYNNKKKN